MVLVNFGGVSVFPWLGGVFLSLGKYFFFNWRNARIESTQSSAHFWSVHTVMPVVKGYSFCSFWPEALVWAFTKVLALVQTGISFFSIRTGKKNRRKVRTA